MSMSDQYQHPEPSRGDIDALSGATLLEFGTPWCGHCQAAQPLLQAALADQPSIRHIKIEDGSGLPLGRSFKVKLWPTLVFLHEGQEVARVVRPLDVTTIQQGLSEIIAGPANTIAR